MGSATLSTSNAASPSTLAIDIGGTGLKASVLDAKGKMLTDRARVPTTYPVTPAQLIDQLVALVTPLPASERVAVGFPGVVRLGHVLTAPHFVTKHGPGTAVSATLRTQWTGFDLAGALTGALGRPTRVLNDADLQGLDVMTGHGVEVIVTLGTGFGTAVFNHGQLSAHLELAQHPFRNGDSYDEQLGDVARKKVGNKTWNRRLTRAIATLNTLFVFDHLYLGGGNTRHVTLPLPDHVTVIDANAGLLGGLRLWELDITS